jgi:hypothetical protein
MMQRVQSCLLVLGLYWQGCQGGKKITFEILPDDDIDEPSSADLYGQFLNAVAPQNRAELGRFDHLKNLSTSVDHVSVIPDADHAAVDIVADAKIRATAQTNIEISAGGGLEGRFVDPIDLVADGLSFSGTGPISAFGGDAHLQADGAISAVAAGHAHLAALSARARLAGALEASAAGNVSLASGGSVSVRGSEGGSAEFAGPVLLSGTSLEVNGTQSLKAVAGAIDLQSHEGVRVESSGASFQLGSGTEMEYIAFVWRSAASFDEWENVVPKIEGVTEVLINGVPGKPQPMARSQSATQLRMDIAVDGAGAGRAPAWKQDVWGAHVGSGSYSLGGLHLKFGEPHDIVGVRLSSAPANNPTFDGWAEVTFHFGRIRSTSAATLRSAGTVEVIAGVALTLSSREVSLTAVDGLELSGGQSVAVSAADALALRSARSLDATSNELRLHAHGELDVFSGGAASANVGTLSLEAAANASLVAGGALALTTGAGGASLESAGAVSLAAASTEVRLAGSLEAYAGRGAELSTPAGASVAAGGELSAFAGERAVLSTGRGGAELQAGGGVHVQTPGGTLSLGGVGGAVGASVVTEGGISIDSGSRLDARAGAVRIVGHAQTSPSNVRFAMSVGCAPGATNCSDTGSSNSSQLDEEQVLQELARLLGVPRSRLVARRHPATGADGEASASAAAGAAGTSGRRRTQQQDHDSPPPPPPSDGAYKGVKRSIVRHLTKHFRGGGGSSSSSLSAAEHKAVMQAVLASQPGDEIDDAWSLFGQAGEGGGASGDSGEPDLDAFSAAVLLLVPDK